MLVVCWSVKGGSGTTVVAAALAVLAARWSGGALLVDLDGDLPAALGLPEPQGPGVRQWLGGGDTVPADALARLEVPVAEGLTLLPAGPPLPPTDVPGAPDRAAVLASVLAADPRPVVVDAGRVTDGASRVVAAAAPVSLLVLRPCYVALRRAVTAPVAASGLVLVREPGRSLSARDVSEVLGLPVRAEVDVDPAVARAVDAGLLAGRLPRPLARALRAVA